MISLVKLAVNCRSLRAKSSRLARRKEMVSKRFWINANFRMVACEKKWTGRLGSSKLLEGGNSTDSSSSIKTRSGTCSSTLARDAENSRA